MVGERSLHERGKGAMTNDLAFNYFIGSEGEQFSFIKVPKLFFTDIRFENLSYGAKILYGLLLDRMSLSRKNKWLDNMKRVFVLYTIESIQDDFHVSKTVAVRFLKELEEFGLIEKKKRPNEATMIYVKNFVIQEEEKSEIQGSPEYGMPEVQEMEVQNMESQKDAEIQGSLKSGLPNNRIPGVQNMESNKTNINKTNNILSSSSITSMDGDIRKQIMMMIKYNKILDSNDFDEKLVDEVMKCLITLFVSPRKKYKIDKAYISFDKMQNKVKERLTEENCRKILMNISMNGTETIYNLHSYILTCFYNLVTVENKSILNRFTDFTQNNYDFELLEKKLISKKT